jgi:hypothetical protein
MKGKFTQMAARQQGRKGGDTVILRLFYVLARPFRGAVRQVSDKGRTSVNPESREKAGVHLNLTV